MATTGTLGSFSYQMLLDYAQFTDALNKSQQQAAAAANQITKSLQGAVDSVGDSFKQLATLVGVGFSLDGLKTAVDQVTKLDTSVGDLADTFGVSIAAFSDLNAAATVAGKGLDDVAGSLKQLETASSKAQAGNAQMVEAFRAIGISVQQLKSLSPEDLLEAVAKGFDDQAASANRTANMVALFGRNATALLPTLKQLAQGAHDTATAFNAVITPDNVAKSVAYTQAMGHVQLAIQGVEQSLVQNVVPALTQAANEFAAMISTSSTLQSVIHGLGDAAQFLADHLEGVVLGVSTLAEIGLAAKIATWTEELAKFTEEATGVSAVIGGVGTAAVGAVGVGIAAFAGWQIGTWARENFAWIAEIGTWIGDGVAAAQSVVVASFTALWTAVKATFQAFIASIQSGLAAPFQGLADQLQGIAPQMATGFQQIANSIKPAISGTDLLATGANKVVSILDAAGSEIKDFWGAASGDSSDASKAVDAMTAFKAAVQAADAVAAQGHLSDDTYEATLLNLSDAYKKATAGVGDASKANSIYSQTVGILGAAIDTTGTKVSGFVADVAAGKKVIDESGAALDSFQATVDKLLGDSGGPAEKALQAYNAGIIAIGQAADDAAIKGADVDQVIVLWNQGIAALGQTYANTMAKIIQESDYFSTINDEFNKQIASIKGLSEAQQVQEQYLKDLKTAQDALTKSMGEGVTVSDDEKVAILANAQAHVDLMNQTKLDVEAAKQWQSIWVTAGNGVADTFAKTLVEGGNLFDGLKSLAQQTVEAIISYFLKLAVINPILNSIFGGQAGFSILPSLFGGSSAGGGGIGSLLSGGGGGSSVLSGSNPFGNVFSNLFGDGGAAAAASSAGQSVGVLSDLGSGGNAFTASGFTTDWGAAGESISDGIEAGAPAIGDSIGSSIGTSFLGKALPVVGGALAALSEFKAAGGGLGGVAGAAAYGLGTLTAAGAATGLLGGAGAAAGAAGALGSVGLAAVPVVGWIALAATVVNMLTKGGLFGTSYSPTGNTQETFSVDSSGASASAAAEESKKKPLFGGRSWKDVSIPVPDSTSTALDQFFTTLQTGLVSFAAQFGTTTANVVSGSFNQTFDKTGKVTGTTETVGGQSYNDTTGQQFEERIQADSYLAVLDKMGLAATDFVKGAEGDADTLMAAVQDFASTTQEANTNLANGFKFMGLASDQSLVDVIKFTEGLQQSGETLSQTYQRLIAAQQQYDQYVAQFAPQATFASSYQSSLSGIYNSEIAAIAQANAYAQAAGAASASTKDLSNIMDYYSQQAAAATAQLQESAQEMAFSLGLSNQGSLDQINQEIAALTSGSSDASSSLGGFNSAIQKTSQAATDAMNLLLGDLSPLNDQQKLQVALQGLRAGTVTQDQVLQIGRSLYASSEAYTALFNEVQGMGKKGNASISNKGGGGSSSSQPTLSPADQAKLTALESERDALQKANTLTQFQSFAQQVADLATAKGEDFTQVLSDLGVKQADLEKGLGLQSDADLAKYIAGLQAQTDSAGDNTQDIVDAITGLPAQIAAALGAAGFQTGVSDTAPGSNTGPITQGGAVVSPSGTASTMVPPASTTPSGPPSGSAGGYNSNDLTTAISRGVSSGVAPYAARLNASTPRSSRWNRPVNA
jgi:hypothetical protein